jgi:predicted nuclease of predicted toxin-antitoxin system
VRAKLDENLGRTCAAILSEAGHDVSTVREQGMSSWKDDRVLAECVREGRTLVTLDLDFANPLRYPPGDTRGIVVLRLPSPITLPGLRSAILSLEAVLTTRSVEGKLWIVQPGAVREYEGQPG